MRRDRKELAAGATEQEAWENLCVATLSNGRIPVNVERANDLFDFVHDEQTGIWSVFHKRRGGNGGRRLTRAVTRESAEPYSEANRARDRRPLVLQLVPTAAGELVAMRLKGTRRTYFMDWNELFRTMVWRHGLAAKAQKRKAKADRRKARRQQRRKH